MTFDEFKSVCKKNGMLGTDADYVQFQAGWDDSARRDGMLALTTEHLTADFFEQFASALLRDAAPAFNKRCAKERL